MYCTVHCANTSAATTVSLRGRRRGEGIALVTRSVWQREKEGKKKKPLEFGEGVREEGSNFGPEGWLPPLRGGERPTSTLGLWACALSHTLSPPFPRRTPPCRTSINRKQCREKIKGGELLFVLHCNRRHLLVTFPPALHSVWVGRWVGALL